MNANRMPDLIYDIGAHLGEDTAFYLAKGYRVVAIEADPLNCAAIRSRFPDHLKDGNLILINGAINRGGTNTTLWRFAGCTFWSTTDPTFAERNRRLGHGAEEIEVQGLELSPILRRYGVPYYLKIDIEGADCICLESLLEFEAKPKYISIESSKTSFCDITTEFRLLDRLGYKDFKVVPQHRVQEQTPPVPALEGTYVEWKFPSHASGLFGEETPGPWMTAKKATDSYRWIFLQYRLVGDQPLVRSQVLRSLLYRLGITGGWYDTHARASG